MLDPTLIGLLGVAVGAGVTTWAALITSGRTRGDKRRELQRAAYARGLEAISTFNRCRTDEDYATCWAHTFEARRDLGVRAWRPRKAGT